MLLDQRVYFDWKKEQHVEFKSFEILIDERKTK